MVPTICKEIPSRGKSKNLKTPFFVSHSNTSQTQACFSRRSIGICRLRTESNQNSRRQMSFAFTVHIQVHVCAAGRHGIVTITKDFNGVWTVSATCKWVHSKVLFYFCFVRTNVIANIVTFRNLLVVFYGTSFFFLSSHTSKKISFLHIHPPILAFFLPHRSKDSFSFLTQSGDLFFISTINKIKYIFFL